MRSHSLHENLFGEHLIDPLGEDKDKHVPNTTQYIVLSIKKNESK